MGKSIKKIALTSMIFAWGFCGFSEAKSDFSFSIKPYAGIRSGEINEYVLYKIEKNNPADTISRLDWNYFNSMVGFATDFSYKNKILTEANVSFSLPFSTGSMEDSDWMNIYSTGENFKTHYSWNKNRTDFFTDDFLRLGYNWQPLSFLNIFSYGEYGFEHFKFVAYDGYKQYGTALDVDDDGYKIYAPYSPDQEKIAVGGDMVSFYGIHNFIGGGFRLGFTPSEKFDLKLGESVLYSFYSKQVDNHIRINKKYGYNGTGAIRFITELTCDYRINEHNRVGLLGSFNFIPRKENNMYILNDEGKWANLDNIGDFKQIMYTVGISYLYCF